MHWPQYVLFGWVLLEMGWAIGKDGQPKTGQIDGWSSVFAYGLLLCLLYMGGFFGGS